MQYSRMTPTVCVKISTKKKNQNELVPVVSTALGVPVCCFEILSQLILVSAAGQRKLFLFSRMVAKASPGKSQPLKTALIWEEVIQHQETSSGFLPWE